MTAKAIRRTQNIQIATFRAQLKQLLMKMENVKNCVNVISSLTFMFSAKTRDSREFMVHLQTYQQKQDPATQRHMIDGFG